MPQSPFHLAITVRDIPEARHFYGELMGFAEGRSDAHWIDFDMFGHQLVTHLDPTLGKSGRLASISNPVDGHGVPVPHFGVVLTLDEWARLRARVVEFVAEFIVEPHTRFAGEAGEQRTMFFTDPSGNALEFKAFRDIERDLFAKD